MKNDGINAKFMIFLINFLGVCGDRGFRFACAFFGMNIRDAYGEIISLHGGIFVGFDYAYSSIQSRIFFLYENPHNSQVFLNKVQTI